MRRPKQFAVYKVAASIYRIDRVVSVALDRADRLVYCWIERQPLAVK